MERMNHRVADRLVTFLAASLVVFATASGCGDSVTEPLAPTPDPPRPTTATVSPAEQALRTPALDRASLVALYEATGGPNWSNSENWLSDAPLGEWRGVGVDSAGRVTSLTLPENNLSGELPKELGSLSGLELLELGGNTLTGPIPAALGQLSLLENLDLAANALTDSIPPELGNLSKLERLRLGRNRLQGRIPPELGNLSALRDTWLGDNELSGPIPRELGNLAELWNLDLGGNALEGAVPTELGDLNLGRLDLEHNQLTGLLPRSLLRTTTLRHVKFEENPELCAPGVPDFLSWSRTLETFEGPFCNDADRAALDSLYRAASGANWTNSDGWLEAGFLGEWYGVSADSLGRVVSLDLAGNGLSGRVPGTLVEMTEMTVLRLGSNALSGRLPLSLSRIPIVEFSYADTALCTPPEASFRAWLEGIPQHEGTGEECAPYPDRAALIALYESTDGRNWTTRDDWLTDAPLGEWHGVETDGEGRVTGLDLQRNGLAGAIPSELGDLSRLQRLSLSDNQLEGRIPPELGNLSRLTYLNLRSNAVAGPLPPELGGLVNLEYLSVGHNRLTGPIPPELGNLSSLTSLSADYNRLTGPIPPELGNLSNLRGLRISGNDLSGPIPPELGNLSSLTRLSADGNRMTGRVPPELGNLSQLWWAGFVGNQLTGALPASMTGLTRLEYLGFGGNAGLCAPGSAGFVEWTRGLEHLDGPFCNEADVAALNALHQAAGGAGWTNSGGWLGDGSVGEWHGVSADSLGQVTGIDLAANGLAGLIPPELGNFGRLTALRLGGNALSGRLPQSLTRVPLREFRYAETELCAPPAAAFQEWLAGIELHEGTGTECVPVSDRDVLTTLYEATGGPNWTNSENWLTDASLEDWHGVDVDGEGRVAYIDLSDNGLTGPIPPELGNLSRLEELVLNDNDLAGEIPPEIGNLTHLTYLNLRDNAVAGPLPPELGGLVNLRVLSVVGNRLTGPVPPELGNLSNLRRLYAWENRLTGPLPPELGRLSELEVLSLGRNPLTGPIPPELGNLSNLRELGLGREIWWVQGECDKGRHPDRPVCYPSLTGTIPHELGNLSNLESLDLAWNDLSGSIPAELGNLRSLRVLRLESNRLSGPIPPEIGELSSLSELLLAQNRLTGPVPSTIGGLSRLERLALPRNELTGALPPQLGRLSGLRTLDAEYNGLTGHLPPQLGRLAHLEELVLGFNDLAGSVPAEFGRLASLRELILTANAALSGALPDGLAALGELKFLATGGTGLCAPSGAVFEAWLAALSSAHVATCGGGAPAAYLVQAVQSRDNPVPLVAGDDALARVFPTAATETDAGIPPVRVRFYIDGRETHVEDIAGKPGPVPTEVDEGALETSANAVIPGSLIQPGLEMVAEIDPDGTLDPSLGVARRIPETGRLAVDVRALPKFRLTVVPFLSAENPDSTVLDIVEAMAADPLNHELLWEMRTLLPIADDYELTVHDPVVFTPEVFRQITLKAEAIRVMEGSDNYHMGMMTGDVGETGSEHRIPDLSGANTGCRTIGTDGRNIIAHEFGHNMTLGHGPGCFPGSRDPWTDPAYPYSTGIAGVWGYDFRDGGALVRPTRRRRDGVFWRRLGRQLDQRLPLRDGAPPQVALRRRPGGGPRRAHRVPTPVGRRGRSGRSVPGAGVRDRCSARAAGLGRPVGDRRARRRRPRALLAELRHATLSRRRRSGVRVRAARAARMG